MWIFLLYNRANGTVTSKAASATNIKKYLVPAYSALYTYVISAMNAQAEFFLVEKDKKDEGLYLFIDANNADEPKVGRFTVGG